MIQVDAMLAFRKFWRATDRHRKDVLSYPIAIRVCLKAWDDVCDDSLADEKPDVESKVDRLLQLLKGTSNKRSGIFMTTSPLLQVNKSQHHLHFLHHPFLPQE